MNRKSYAQTSNKRRIMGLMAGTSADGIDAACVEIRGTGLGMKVRFLWHFHQRFSPALQTRLYRTMAPAATRTEDLARLHADLGDAFARAACRALDQCPPTQRPQVISLAGQTVCHLPGTRRRPTVTLQLGEPARVAQRTGLVTVADFRQADVAAGGQGAPLVPWADWILFRHETETRIVQNIGGIANVTFLPAGQRPERVVAFDTGPGNMVIDALAGHFSGGTRKMDRHGAMAARGTIREDLLAEWLKHPFFRRKPPKTTGREIFGRMYVDEILTQCRQRRIRAEDVLATATALTVRTIARSWTKLLDGSSRRSARSRTSSRQIGRRGRHPARAHASAIIVAGGGAKNRTLMNMLAEEIAPTPVIDIACMGIPAQAREAVSFAVLAAARLDGLPANLPQVTGAEKQAVMGALYHP